MARKGSSTAAQQQQQTEQQQEQDSGTEVAVQGPAGDTLLAVQLKDDEGQQDSDTDIVQELLAGNYSEDIVNEVRAAAAGTAARFCERGASVLVLLQPVLRDINST
jgi:hypothetical protein